MGVPQKTGYPNVKEIIYPNSIEVIEVSDNGFWGGAKSSVESIVLSENIKEIPDNAFEDCYELSSIIIPNGVEKIGADAFRKCYKLEKIKIPNSVKYIGEYAFSDWKTSQTIINVPSDTTNWDEKWNMDCSANLIYRIDLIIDEIYANLPTDETEKWNKLTELFIEGQNYYMINEGDISSDTKFTSLQDVWKAYKEAYDYDCTKYNTLKEFCEDNWKKSGFDSIEEYIKIYVIYDKADQTEKEYSI